MSNYGAKIRLLKVLNSVLHKTERQTLAASYFVPLSNLSDNDQLVRHFTGLQSLLSTLQQAYQELGLLMLLMAVTVITISRS